MNCALCVLFVMALFLPLIQRHTGLLPEARLYGVERSSTDTPFTFEGWWQGSFQKQFEKRLARRFGLRDFLVRTFNETRFTVFGETYVRTGTHIVIGRDGWLFDREHVLLHGEPAKSTDGERRAAVRDVRRLQDALARRGIAFCVVLAPTKVSVYPEFAPPRLLRPPADRGPSEYELTTPLLEEAGVHLVDAHRLLAGRKQQQPHALFSRTGTHWNSLAAGYVVEALTTELRRQTGRNLAVVRPVGATVDRTPEGTDNDLGQLLNIWRTQQIAGPQVHPILERVAEGQEYAPDLLFVGDSFVHNLTSILDRQRFYGRRDTWYYLRRRFSFPSGADEILDIGKIVWQRELLARDAVVIVISEPRLPNIGFGFVPAALAVLEETAPAQVRPEPAGEEE